MGHGSIQVYFLSTFHFNGSALDVLSSEALDVAAPAMQAELVQLVAQLRVLCPDRIFVEWPLERQAYADETYSRYRARSFELGTNEVYQIGYRLADVLGHERLYCVDAEGDWDYEVATEYARLHHQLPLLESLHRPEAPDAVTTAIRARTGINGGLHELTQLNGTLHQRLLALNDKRADTLNMDWYLLGLARLGSVGHYPGADLVGDFYKRNVRIYTNVLRALDLERDQVLLLLIGQGHTAFLKSLLAYSSLFVVQDIRPYLLPGLDTT